MAACVLIRPGTLPGSSIVSMSVITLIINLLLLLLERCECLAIRRGLLGRGMRVLLLGRRRSTIIRLLGRCRALVVAAVLRPTERQFELLVARLDIC